MTDPGEIFPPQENPCGCGSEERTNDDCERCRLLRQIDQLRDRVNALQTEADKRAARFMSDWLSDPLEFEKLERDVERWECWIFWLFAIWVGLVAVVFFWR